MYNIIHIRVDDRLIHGQVANRWCSEFQIDRIIVANDLVCLNNELKAALRIATPSSINTSIISVDKAIENLKDSKYEKQKLMIIFNNVFDVKRFIDCGIVFKQINIGNLSKRNNTTQIKKSVCLSVDEINCIYEIENQGVEVLSQMLPESSKDKIKELLKNESN